MNFNERVKRARGHARLTQGQLASITGMTQRGIDRAENQKMRTGSAATVQIARACKVSAWWLATGEGDMEVSDAADFSEESMLVALATEHLPAHLRDHYVKELLGVAINFLPASHPQYKRAAAVYRKTQKRETVREELKGTPPRGR